MGDRSLQDFVNEVSGDSHLRIEHDFGDGFVRLRTSEADRRQAAQDIRCSEDIVIELLRNARDAHASHIFMAVSKDERRRTITVIDDGDGIPASMHELVFEPRVTSKLDTSHMDAWGLHGRGMALYSIAQNSLTARVVSSESKRGCALSVTTDTGVLREKTDQSSFPRFLMTGENTVDVRGPKNILRTSCEFAIESRDDCSVTVGTQTEIAAALYSYGLNTLSGIERAFCPDREMLPVIKRLATAADCDDFALIASEIGLSVSSRTARRILDGEIEEAIPLLDRISVEHDAPPATGKKKTPRTSTRRARIQRGDAEALAGSVRDAFAPLADRYYLASDVDPTIRVSRDKLVITIPLVDEL